MKKYLVTGLVTVYYTMISTSAFAVPNPPATVPIDDAAPFLIGAGVLYLAKRFKLLSRFK